MLASTLKDKGASLKQFQTPSDLTKHMGLNFERASGMISRSEFQHKCRQTGPLRTVVVKCDLEAAKAARAKEGEAGMASLTSTGVTPPTGPIGARASTTSVDSFDKATAMLNHIGDGGKDRRATAWGNAGAGASDTQRESIGEIKLMEVGHLVVLQHFGNGILRYIGADKLTPSADIVICGVELDTPSGSGDGTYEGVRYFDCPPQRGITFPLGKILMSSR
jgi:hypothetical protein